MNNQQIAKDLIDNKIKSIRLHLSGCMGGGTDGLTEFRRARKGKAKTFRGSKGRVTRQSISLLKPGQTKVKKFNAYKLWINTHEDGTVTFSASFGDMGLTIKDIQLTGE